MGKLGPFGNVDVKCCKMVLLTLLQISTSCIFMKIKETCCIRDIFIHDKCIK